MVSFVAMWIVGIVFALVGAPMVWLAQRTFARDRAISGWPRANGIVTSAKLEASTDRVTDENTGLHHYTKVYTPRVEYTYCVGDQALQGTKVARVAYATSHDAAKAIIDKYAPEQQVTVLYDPSDPKTAYLEVHRSVGAVILLAFGLVWIALGGLLVTLSFIYA